MQRYKLLVAYDGFAYSGWQVQPGFKTIQGEMERCFREFARDKVIVHGSGRTDRGVHAREQSAHVDLPFAVAPQQVMRALNARLPPDIRLLNVRRAPPGFHARRSAASKEYRYLIWNAPVMSPFLYRYRMHIRGRLDVGAMRKAARFLVGRRDFAALTANPRRSVESTVRTITRLAVSRRGREVAIAVRSDGFLYRMVRSIAGLLIRVGLGDLQPGEAQKILERRERTAVVPTAPPHGLFLWKVYY